MRCVNRWTFSGPDAGAAAQHDLVAEVQAHAVAVVLDPRRPPARAEHPRHRRVVALRDAADVEHVGRAVRAGVGAVGAELQRAAGLVDVQPVARAEADEALLGVAVEHEPDAMDTGGRGGGDDAVVRRDVLDAGLAAVGRVVERLGGDHALGQLDELVLGAARPRSYAHAA